MPSGRFAPLHAIRWVYFLEGERHPRKDGRHAAFIHGGRARLLIVRAGPDWVWEHLIRHTEFMLSSIAPTQ